MLAAIVKVKFSCKMTCKSDRHHTLKAIVSVHIQGFSELVMLK